MVPVILAGGNGSRLWPKSRASYPKQFIALTGEQTLFQQTLLRNQAFAPAVVLCNHRHRFIAAEQASQCGRAPARIMLETQGRNTAGAATLAALALAEQDPVLLIQPADHFLPNSQAFERSARQAQTLAEQGQCVVMGAPPTHAHTGYGYIQANGQQVKQFVEKPDQATANAYLAQGDYLWNIGMVVVRASVLLRAMQTHAPDILAACQQAYNQAQTDLDFLRLAPLECASTSLDYALLEKLPTHELAVVHLATPWADLGSWSAVAQVSTPDAHGNTTNGNGVCWQARNTHIDAANQLVVAAGVQDLVVVATPDAVLVTHKQADQQISQLVATLRQQGHTSADASPFVHRPWGHYQILHAQPGYLVKQLTIQPGHGISLQRHRWRSEHWTVVSGEASVTRDNERLQLVKNQSTVIAPMVAHCVENNAEQALIMIEIQSGERLEEADIERLHDRYGR